MKSTKDPAFLKENVSSTLLSRLVPSSCLLNLEHTLVLSYNSYILQMSKEENEMRIENLENGMDDDD